MEFKLEAVLNKTPAQREEELNQRGNVAESKLEAIGNFIATSHSKPEAQIHAIENTVLGGNHE